MPDDAVVCVEHVWTLVAADLTMRGTYLEHECDRCGVLAVEGPDEIAGRMVTPRPRPPSLGGPGPG